MVLSIAAGASAQLELRTGQALPAPEVIAVGPEGVVVGENARSAFVIGWDRVLRFDGPQGADAAAYLPLGEAMWRARTRLERGDAAGAEPTFEALVTTLSGRGGPMPAVAAEGLLRCRLRRGAQVGAIEPWLAWLAARSGSSGDGALMFAADWSARAGLDPIMDAGTGLIPAVPPIWLDWPPVRVFATAPVATPPQDGRADKARALADLYLHAARFEAGVDEPFPAVASASDPGVALVLDIVLARTGADGDRAGARGRLGERLAAARDTWTEAWCRAAIGRSLIRESDVDTRRLGVVELLHLPARFSRSHPYLAGLCLAEASVALTDLGDSAGAAGLRGELFDHYPDHPVLAWERVRVPALVPAPVAPSSGGGSGARRSPRVIPLSVTECLLP